MVKVTFRYFYLRYVFKSIFGKVKFSLNYNIGFIFILELIKRQQVVYFEFEVIISDRKVFIRVLVKVVSVNINFFEFIQTAYKVFFDENVFVGIIVMSVSVVDFDEGENGYVIYSIVNLNYVSFVINYFIGVVSILENLDYEFMFRVYILRIRALDWGLLYRREVEVFVIFIFNNLNDNIFLFEKINCEGIIFRDFGVGE